MGGAGILQYYPLGMALVVNQTRAVHDEIRDMLNALRPLQEVEVAVELRLVSMRSSVAVDLKALTHRDEPDSQWATDPNERIEQMLNASEDLPIIRFWLKQGAEQAAAPKAKTVGILSQKQLAAWLNLAQGDNGTNIMHAPKVTIFNGQHAGVVIAQQMPVVTEYKVVRENDQVAIKPNNETIELGLRCGLLPTVSADRRSVQLKVDFRHTELEGQVTEMPVVVRARRKGGSEAEIQAALQQVKVRTLTFKETCSIPDGRTLVVSLGQVTTDTRIEQGTPILKDIPFLGRCFTNVGYGREEREMFLFVTPRIIVTEAEEQPVLTEIPMPDGR